MAKGASTARIDALNVQIIDRLAESTGVYPICYQGDGHWFFLLKGEKLAGFTPADARHALAEALRLQPTKATASNEER